MNKETVKSIIRDVPDFPKPGILFKDITTLFNHPEGWNYVVEQAYNRYKNKGITKIIGIESRGFLLGATLANKLGVGFVPVRKPGKLPWKTYSENYKLEYGEDTVEIHQDAIEENDVVLIHDDLLATGGTMEAVINLVNRFNCTIHEVSFIIELGFLEGRKKIESKNMDCYSYISY